MILTRRLHAIFTEIEGKTCADIGCDHGKLIVQAVIDNKIEHGYAIDISAESLQKAQLLAEEYNIENHITFLQGNGSLPLENKKVDVSIIAGMGALETISILKQGDFASKYILAPHQDVPMLREYLAKNNYTIEKDFIVFDKKFYNIITCKKGENNYKEYEIILGKNYPNSEDFENYILFRKNIIEKLLESVGNKVDNKIKIEKEAIDAYLQNK